MSALRNLDASLLPGRVVPSSRFPLLTAVLLVLVLTLLAIVVDQSAAPILITTSPLWATFAFLLLVWRRGELPLPDGNGILERSLSKGRLAVFVLAHVVLVLLSRSLSAAVGPFAGTPSFRGTLVGLYRLAVLVPTLALFSFRDWKQLLRTYKTEATAAILVLTLNVPGRILEAIWPSYSQIFGWSIYLMSRIFVPGLTYETGPEPTIVGPFWETSIVFACSGISAFELLGYIFGLVVVLDWNYLRKGRALLIYLGCLFFMLFSNALRIATLVVLGNRGFTNLVEPVHASAGAVFFCAVFLLYISFTYKWMTESRQFR